MGKLWESKRDRRERADLSFAALAEELETKYLGSAFDAAERGDIVTEETLIAAAAFAAEQANVAEWFNGLIVENSVVGGLRDGADYIGHIDQYLFLTNRVVVFGSPGKVIAVRPVDHHLTADVDASGGVDTTSRPTLTRMAATAFLPGSALLPGLAMQKRTTHDSRELYLTIEHPAWAAVLPVRPEDALAVRQIAAGLNQAAAALRAAAAPAGAAGVISDPLDRLERLAALRDRGALTNDEFAAEKRKVLDGP